MAMLSTISALVGVVLGFHYKVFILVPAIGLAGSVVAANGIAGGESGGQVALSIVVAVMSIQIGYVGGTVVRHIFDAARARYGSRGRQSARDAFGRIA
jgi:hypothetical protein